MKLKRTSMFLLPDLAFRVRRGTLLKARRTGFVLVQYRLGVGNVIGLDMLERLG